MCRFFRWISRVLSEIVNVDNTDPNNPDDPGQE